MPNDTNRRFSDDEAARVWRRAAELQAARRLPAPAAEGAGADAAPAPDQLSGDEIVAIGAEAGIDAEFVQQALAEARFAPPAAAGEPEYRTRRRIDAPMAVVQATLEEVAARDPFGLRLVDLQPAGDARLLVFDISANWGGALNAGSMAAAPNIVALHALLQPGADPDTTEVTLHGPPNPGLPRSVRRHDLGFGGFGGALGGLFGAGIAAEAALSGALLVAPAAAGALAVGAAGVWVMRAAQKWARRKDAGSLEQLADELVGAVRIRRHAKLLDGGGG